MNEIRRLDPNAKLDIDIRDGFSVFLSGVA